MKRLVPELIVISILTGLVLVLISQYASIPAIERTEQVMGTYATITILDRDTARAERALDAAFEEIRRIEALMSAYNASSEVAALTRNGTNWTALSPDTLYVLTKADYYARISNGSFDVTCNPLVTLWMDTVQTESRLPTPEEVEAAKALVGYEQLQLDEAHGRARFAQPGMSITLGGIAKGYAVDRACDQLLAAGIEHALVNIGGDMRAIGDKNGAPWAIALQNPRNKEEYLTILKLEDEAVATSGDYERYFILKERIHHIINPKTGYSADECISVTVIAERCIDADALSTTVFVLGPEAGKALLDAYGYQGLIISADKELITSNSFAEPARAPAVII
jgi:thiamine biosynthesis lipoprotein